jgi:hypothetical protein
MNLTFLAPFVLAGLAHIAIPIFVHLTHKEKKQPVLFPSLMFLRRVPFRTAKRQRIRHWLLFLLRVTAIALIVAAFARPLLDTSALGLAVVGQSREVVVLLDRSYSMTYGDRWERAKTATVGVMADLGPGDRATLVAFADKAQPMTTATSDPISWEAAVDRVEPGGGRTQLGPAIQLARDLLEVSELAIREVVLITDFQRSAWDGTDAARMPGGTAIRAIHVGDSSASNVAVADAVVDRSQAGARDQVRISSRVVNPGGGAVTLPVTLTLDGETIETQDVAVPASGAVVVSFTTQMVPDRVALGQVSVVANDVAADNAFYFVVAPIVPVRILVLTSPAGRTSDLLYVQEALAVGDDPPYEVQVKRASDFRAADLDGMDGLILADAPPPQGTSGQALDAWIRAGGGLLVALGPRTGAGAWPPDARALIGGAPGGVVDRLEDRGATLSILSYEHPVFEPFATPRSGDFSVARFLRYRDFTPAPDPTGESQQMLVRFDDGGPAMFERRLGRGKVLVWTGGVANLWNDLPLKPVFLPFIHQVARYLGAYREEPVSHTVGQVAHVDEARLVGEASDEIVIESPGGNRVAVAVEGDVPVALDQAGFYTARRLAGGTTEGVVVAANPDPREAALATVSQDEVLLALQPDNAASERTETLAASLTAGQKERRQALWWYLLIAATVFLLMESALAHRTVDVVR